MGLWQGANILAWGTVVDFKGIPLGLVNRLTEVSRGADESYPVTVTGWARRARLSPGGHSLFEVQAKMPLDEPVVAAAADMLEAVAEGARRIRGMEALLRGREGAEGPRRAADGAARVMLPSGGQAA
jgi:hypothetical protein